MEQEIPEWLKDDFLSTVLQGGTDAEPKISIMKFNASLAVAPGNNYMSHMYRVKVEFKVANTEEVKVTSLMVKAPTTKGIVAEMADKLDIFGSEGKVYSKILPMMREKFNHEFGPQQYFCPVKGIVLKDLKEEGYIMCDRLKQLDFHHCESALKTLAKFHATSVACYHDNPELVSSFTENIFADDASTEEEYGQWVHNSITKLGGVISDIGGCKEIGEYITSRADSMLKSIIERLKFKEKGLNVLNHGDFWTNNMMFKYNASGAVEDVKLIDFQLTKYTTPVVDLLYFMWASAREEVLVRQIELFNIYRETLNYTLEELQCEERLSEEELMDDLRFSTDWSLYIICSMLPVFLGDSENVVNFEEMSEKDFKDPSKQDESLSKVFNGKYYKAALPSVMKQFSVWIPSITQ